MLTVIWSHISGIVDKEIRIDLMNMDTRLLAGRRYAVYTDHGYTRNLGIVEWSCGCQNVIYLMDEDAQRDVSFIRGGHRTRQTLSVVAVLLILS